MNIGHEKEQLCFKLACVFISTTPAHVGRLVVFLSPLVTADLACDFDHILWPIFGAPCLSLRHVSARAQVPVLGLVTVARRAHILISCHHAGLVSQDGSQLSAHNTHGEAKHGGAAANCGMGSYSASWVCNFCFRSGLASSRCGMRTRVAGGTSPYTTRMRRSPFLRSRRPMTSAWSASL